MKSMIKYGPENWPTISPVAGRDDEIAHIGGIKVDKCFAGLERFALDITLPETSLAPENWWLEDEFSFWDGPISGAVLVSGRVQRLDS